MKKPAIPKSPNQPERARFDSAIKETLEVITGVRGEKITSLDANAGISDVINKVNEILAMMQ